MKTGDKVYLVRYTSGFSMTPPAYVPGEVLKVTPRGMSDVQLPGSVIRLNAKGVEAGADKYARYELDAMAFDARVIWVAKKRRLEAAAVAVRAVTERGSRPNSTWGVELLGKELDAIQALVDAARAKIAAVDAPPTTPKGAV